MSKMKSHRGLMKRVKVNPSGKIKRSGKAKESKNKYISTADLKNIKKLVN